MKCNALNVKYKSAFWKDSDEIIFLIKYAKSSAKKQVYQQPDFRYFLCVNQTRQDEGNMRLCDWLALSVVLFVVLMSGGIDKKLKAPLELPFVFIKFLWHKNDKGNNWHNWQSHHSYLVQSKNTIFQWSGHWPTLQYHGWQYSFKHVRFSVILYYLKRKMQFFYCWSFLTSARILPKNISRLDLTSTCQEQCNHLKTMIARCR